MNIFAIESDELGNIDWKKSATSQDNYRVVKMILESCQMLCAVLNEQHGNQVTPYKTTHKNHPSTKWVAASSNNFCKLVEHCEALIEEYTRRFNKQHKCAAVLDRCVELFEPSRFPTNEPTRLPLAMPEEYKSNNIVESYRKFYASKEKMRYPKDAIPPWFIEYRGDLEYQVI